MKTYSTPEIKVIKINKTDIITTSGGLELPDDKI